MATGYHSLPCPCGSGKPFDECCFRGSTRRAPSPMDDAMDAFQEAQQGRTFASLDDARMFMQEFMVAQNTAPRKAFAGLSSEQMRRFLSMPFDSPDLVCFSDVLPHEPATPVTDLFSALAEAIGEKGLKPTAKGNLPQKTVRDIATRIMGSDTFTEFSRPRRIFREEDYFRLHITRIVAGLAGLIRKHKGRFMLTKKCRTLMDKHGMAGIWPVLFRAFAEKFNWAYISGYYELHIVQRSFLFTLYLLHRFGSREHDGGYYVDAFLSAFPVALDEIPPREYTTPDRIVRSTYLGRTFDAFLPLFGLACVVRTWDKVALEDRYRIDVLTLLEDAVQFHISEGRSV